MPYLGAFTIHTLSDESGASTNPDSSLHFGLTDAGLVTQKAWAVSRAGSTDPAFRNREPLRLPPIS